jgi:hypothetical protein
LTTSSSEIPPGPLHDDLSWQHTNWHAPEEMVQAESLGAPQLHDDPLSQHTDSRLLGETLQGGSSGTSSTTSGDPHLQVDLPPALGSPEVHDDASWRWLYDFRANEGVSLSSDFDSEAPMPVESEAPPPAPEAHTFFNDAMKQKLKTFAEFGAVAGLSAAVTLQVHQLIKSQSHGAYVSFFFPPSPANI